MQDTSSPHKGWLSGLPEAQPQGRRHQISPGPQVFGFIVALALLLTYICSPWMQ